VVGKQVGPLALVAEGEPEQMDDLDVGQHRLCHRHIKLAEAWADEASALLDVLE
jgi:hypothetical protein